MEAYGGVVSGLLHNDDTGTVLFCPFQPRQQDQV